MISRTAFRLALFAALGLFTGCVGSGGPTANLTAEPSRFDRLIGWREDRVSSAVPALLASCARFLKQGESQPLDSKPRSLDFGTVGEWRPICREAERLPPGDDLAARNFFERSFVPVLAGNNGDPSGVFTGYYELELRGSRRRSGRYQTPLYRRPPEVGAGNLPSRAEIEDGALAGRGLELFWVEDPIDAFVLQIQGSGRILLPDGSSTRVGYDGQNGRSYVPVGRLLAQRGEMRSDQVTMPAIREWMVRNPEGGRALRRENPSYVFFRDTRGDGPFGAEGAVLTSGRSLAVDRAFLPLGLPIWLEARDRYDRIPPIHQLVVAQDTGGAIKGPVRGDFYWGSGAVPGQAAGNMNAAGRYYLFLPRPAAARLGR